MKPPKTTEQGPTDMNHLDQPAKQTNTSQLKPEVAGFFDHVARDTVAATGHLFIINTGMVVVMFGLMTADGSTETTSFLATVVIGINLMALIFIVSVLGRSAGNPELITAVITKEKSEMDKREKQFYELAKPGAALTLLAALNFLPAIFFFHYDKHPASSTSQAPAEIEFYWNTDVDAQPIFPTKDPGGTEAPPH